MRNLKVIDGFIQSHPTSVSINAYTSAATYLFLEVWVEDWVEVRKDVGRGWCGDLSGDICGGLG